MGSFDGMDPTLVRDLLAEVRRAAVQMRSLESRVAQATRSAGLATPVTHRPSQVADACEEMARDVTGRLALLEKKEAAPRVGEQAKDISPNGTPASGETKDPAPKDSKEPREDDRASRTANPRETTTPNDPPSSSDPAPRKDPTPPEPESKRDPTPADPESKKDPAPTEPVPRKDPTPPEPESRKDPAPAQPEPKQDPAPAEPESKRDPAPAEPAPKKDPEPAPKSESTPRDAPDETAPKTGETPEPRPTPQPDSRVGDVPSATDQPKDGDRDSRHDRGTEPGTPGQDILDTPAKDHPDDIDQSDAGKPQVVEVDGVKVLQIPLDPPTAREIADLLDDVEAVRPTDLPSMEGSAAPLAPAVQPLDTSLTPAVQPPSNGPSAPLTPAVQPPVDTSLTPAVQPPSNGPSAPLTPAVQPPVDTSLTPAVQPPVESPLTQAVQPQEGTSGATTGATASGGWADDGGDVVSVDARPPSDAALRSLVDNASDIGPMEMPSVEVPPGEWGRGEWVPKDFGPDGAAGSVDPGGAASQASGGGDSTSARGAVYEGPAAGQQSESASSAGSASPPEPTRASDATAAASGRAEDGGDVVSVDARPPSDAALRSLVDNASDIGPMEMPSVEVPPGEWGKGEWVPKDFGPDGEPGRVEPGAPGRPTVPPGS
ncbi:hypothetical protein [Nonomuraea dietziae]|uniref:hypothetical protein n=1 Tax=Nonomuraea dietziae TaxID=65515 RepID=UPI0035F0A495